MITKHLGKQQARYIARPETVYFQFSQKGNAVVRLDVVSANYYLLHKCANFCNGFRQMYRFHCSYYGEQRWWRCSKRPTSSAIRCWMLQTWKLQWYCFCLTQVSLCYILCTFNSHVCASSKRMTSEGLNCKNLVCINTIVFPLMQMRTTCLNTQPLWPTSKEGMRLLYGQRHWMASTLLRVFSFHLF